MNETNWDFVNKINCPNESYNKFIQRFSTSYDKTFPEVKIKIKTKTLLSRWITKGLLKSSKRKQKLYNKFLKHKTYKNELSYKSYKTLFETLRRKSKKNYSNLIRTHKSF